jgi:L-fuconolactonase
MIIDAQVHAYAANCAQYPWLHPNARPTLPEVTGQQLVAAMDAVGVDAAMLVSPWESYRDDTRYAEEVYRSHPGRFRLVAPIDPNGGGVTARIKHWAATPGAAAIRLLFIPGDGGRDQAAVDQAVAAAAEAGLVVNVLCWDQLAVVDDLARRFPGAQLVLDHLGLRQPRNPPPPPDPFAALDQVLALARHPSVAVKLTGLATYSHRPFPYPDLWQPVGRVIGAFGAGRCLWGTDWQRVTPFLSYQQGVGAFRDIWPLSDADKAQLMGETAARIYHWVR